MTNQARNIRTLLVCFVIAIMVLIPLRFIEIGNSMMEQSQESVLGEVALPEAGGPKVVECIDNETAKIRIEEISERMMTEELIQEEAKLLSDELVEIERRVCR